eukprot:894324-Pleurochrysis_carterae.AAC.1
MVDTVMRKNIFVSDVEITDQGRLNKVTKDKIVEALFDYPEAYAKLPARWKQNVHVNEELALTCEE